MSDVRPTTDHAEARPVRTTPWAFGALLCSVIVFCPLATLLGPLLGLRAIAEVRTRPGTGGTGMAVTAILIGVIATFGWIVAVFWWNDNIRRPMLSGPAREFAAAQQGDYRTFRAGFVGPAAEAGNDEIAAFIREMIQRYGLLLSIQQNETVQADEPEPGRLEPFIPYIFEFETGPREAEVEFALFEEGWFPRPYWKSVIIMDPIAGNLAFPPDATPPVRIREPEEDSHRADPHHGLDLHPDEHEGNDDDT